MTRGFLEGKNIHTVAIADFRYRNNNNSMFPPRIEWFFKFHEKIRNRSNDHSSNMDNTKEICLIPYEKLSPEALQNMIEQFVSRDGVDSGHVDIPLGTKTAMIRSQLQCGEIVIVFDPHTQTCNIVPKDQIPSRKPISHLHAGSGPEKR